MKPILIIGFSYFFNVANVIASTDRKSSIRSSNVSESNDLNKQQLTKPTSSNVDPSYSDYTSDSSASAYKRRVIDNAKHANNNISFDDKPVGAYDEDESCADSDEAEASYSDESEAYETSDETEAYETSDESDYERRNNKKKKVPSSSSAAAFASISKSKTLPAKRLEKGVKVKSQNSAASQDDEKFRQQCIDLYREIKAFAKKQLKLDCKDRELKFNDYKIENWPELVPWQFFKWDRKAYNDLLTAFPKLIFTKKTDFEFRDDNDDQINRIRRELLDRLVPIYNKHTGNPSKRIPWTKCNLYGWPAGVNLAIDRLNRPEVLAVYRQIDWITFSALERGQKRRIVEFSDGSRWEFEGNVPRKKDFAELLRKYQSAAQAQKSSTTESEHCDNNTKSTSKDKKSSKKLTFVVPKDFSKAAFRSESDLDDTAEDAQDAEDAISEQYLIENFGKKCIELIRDIKAFAKKQLNLKCFDKDFLFSDYEIENWPYLVSYSPNNLDLKAYQDLRKALPSLVFKKKTTEIASSTQESAGILKKMRRELLDRLLAIFQEQTGEKSTKIYWIKYNLVGWPARVILLTDQLNRLEILAVWRQIDSIKFLPLQRGQKYRYVEFSDGSRWKFKGNVPNRKEFAELLRKHDEATAKNQNSPLAVDSEDTENTEYIQPVISEPSNPKSRRRNSSKTKKRIHYDEADNSEEDEPSYSEEAESSYSENDEIDSDASEDDRYVKRRSKKYLSSSSAAASSSARAYKTRSSKRLEEVTEITANNVASDSDDSARVLFELDNEDFKQKCIELTREIKTFAKDQLQLNCMHRDFHFRDYEIENWPELVPHHFKNWDQKAYDDLCKALPNLVFKKKDTIAASSRILLKKMIRDLLDRLLEIFNENTGENLSRIKWLEYNLIGWPAGVNLSPDRLNRGEILAVLRQIDFITFLPFEPGQKHRYVVFSDGSRWELEGKMPNRKEFAEMLRRHKANGETKFTRDDDEEHMDVVVPSTLSEPSSSSNSNNLKSKSTSRKRTISKISSNPKQPKQQRSSMTTSSRKRAKSAPNKTHSKSEFTLTEDCKSEYDENICPVANDPSIFELEFDMGFDFNDENDRALSDPKQN